MLFRSLSCPAPCKTCPFAITSRADDQQGQRQRIFFSHFSARVQISSLMYQTHARSCPGLSARWKITLEHCLEPVAAWLWKRRATGRGPWTVGGSSKRIRAYASQEQGQRSIPFITYFGIAQEIIRATRSKLLAQLGSRSRKVQC